MMLETFNWPFFFSAQGLERATMARELAFEMKYLARVAFQPALRQGYLNLQRELTNIANEIEQVLGVGTDAFENKNAA